MSDERDWNTWWYENFDLAMESRLIPTVGDSMGMIRAELFDEMTCEYQPLGRMMIKPCGCSPY